MTSLIWLNTAASTNAVIRDGNFQHGDAVATINQTAGRGRIGREWRDVPGRGLALSLKLEPDEISDTVPLTLVPLVAGVALVDLLDSIAPDAPLWVKWPNDVYLGEHKVAGVLTELAESTGLVVGLGVNISHTAEELPFETATSLAIHGITLDARTLAERWMERFFALVEDTATDSRIEHIRTRLGLMGEHVTVEMPDNSVLFGTVAEVSDSGALVVDDGTRLVTVFAGDVRTLRRRP